MTDIREQLKQPLSRRKDISAVRMGLCATRSETDGDLLRLFPVLTELTNLTRISDLQDDAEQVFIAAVGQVPSCNARAAEHFAHRPAR